MRLAVFLGSSPGPARHQALVAELADALVAHGIGIVYGGAQVGLMGLLADRAMAAGGEVIGVIPRAVFAREVPHTGVARLIEVDSMHERKARMTELADGFVALPGGVGTLEELFEVFTWQLLGLHGKPVALLDPDGYYDPLVEQLDRVVAEGYLSAAKRAALPRFRDVGELLASYDVRA
ncbi:MAG TPA: TIGR00730 family Rossman fold protein [Nocardioides sp.]|uniref:LOG family protein n=1 Tax=Nocardioides sp. TaxID=35761 RepID=UPI002E367457|nr:TIGR00730 family Rossman fold protein [Nocardioides sp.]HEX5086256.1 TIGR00730 family Rossman fold protein [Nocardioides sp.]